MQLVSDIVVFEVLMLDVVVPAIVAVVAGTCVVVVANGVGAVPVLQLLFYINTILTNFSFILIHSKLTD